MRFVIQIDDSIVNDQSHVPEFTRTINEKFIHPINELSFDEETVSLYFSTGLYTACFAMEIDLSTENILPISSEDILICKKSNTSMTLACTSAKILDEIVKSYNCEFTLFFIIAGCRLDTDLSFEEDILEGGSIISSEYDIMRILSTVGMTESQKEKISSLGDAHLSFSTLDQCLEKILLLIKKLSIRTGKADPNMDFPTMKS